VEEIQEPLMQEIRYLDKLVDELARGKYMEKILIRKGGKAKQSFPAFVFDKPTPRHHGG